MPTSRAGVSSIGNDTGIDVQLVFIYHIYLVNRFDIDIDPSKISTTILTGKEESFAIKHTF